MTNMTTFSLSIYHYLLLFTLEASEFVAVVADFSFFGCVSPQKKINLKNRKNRNKVQMKYECPFPCIFLAILCFMIDSFVKKMEWMLIQLILVFGYKFLADCARTATTSVNFRLACISPLFPPLPHTHTIHTAHLARTAYKFFVCHTVIWFSLSFVVDIILFIFYSSIFLNSSFSLNNSSLVLNTSSLSSALKNKMVSFQSF